MNKLVAELLLQQELQNLSALGYEALRNRMNCGPVIRELPGPDGKTYQIEIEIVWDGHTDGTIRLLGGIDDGGFSSVFSPLTLSEFIDPPEAADPSAPMTT